jgi:hypothetical protein
MTDEPQDAKAIYAARDKAKAEKLVKKFERLEGDRAPFDALWQEVAEKISPRHAGITVQRVTPDKGVEARMFDTTGSDALQTMAAGLMSWTTSASEEWFQFAAPSNQRATDAVKLWTQEASHVAQELLANSNYYTSRHENLLTKCAHGTTAMLAEMRNGRLRFESFPIGTYCIEENIFGEVTGFYRRHKLAPSRIVELMGEKALTEDMRKAWEVEKNGGAGKEFDVLHAIYERDRADIPETANPAASIFMPVASCWVCIASKQMLKESGFASMPIFAARYLKWSALGATCPWGYSPGILALPEVKQNNFLHAMLDVMVERAIDPPMMAPDELEGQLIMTARGVNYVNQNVAADRWPRPLYQPADLKTAQWIVEQKKLAIQTKFHVELFQMFANLDRQMTAREVAERAGERLTLITPAFSRDAVEEVQPMMQHVFTLLAESGQLPPPPPEAFLGGNPASGRVAMPKVVLQGRLALAIRMQRNMAASRTLEETLTIAQAVPGVLDNYDFDAMERAKALANGMPAEWLKPEEIRDAQRQQAAEAQQASMAAEMAEKAAGAVQKVGGLEEARELIA